MNGLSWHGTCTRRVALAATDASAWMGMTEQLKAEHGAAVSGWALADACPPNGTLASPAPGQLRRPWWSTVGRADLRGATLQWFTGLFCAGVGAQMAIVPHHFGAPAYDALRPNIGLWGTATLIAGMALLGVAATGGRR